MEHERRYRMLRIYDFEPLEHHFIHTVTDYMTNKQAVLRPSPSCREIRRSRPPPAPEEGDPRRFSESGSATHRLFYRLRSIGPVQYTSFYPYRRLGFAIWDFDRMCGYGLLDPKYATVDNHSYVLAWRSVLRDADLVEIERLKEAWCALRNNRNLHPSDEERPRWSRYDP